MPSCTAQDSQSLRSLSITLVPPSTTAVTVAARHKPPPKPPTVHDCNWCSSAAGGGPRCQGDTCDFPGHGGKKVPCPHEKPARRNVAKATLAPAGQAPSKAEAKAARQKAKATEARANARSGAIAEVSAGLDKIAKALAKAGKAEALEEGEAHMLEFVQGWQKALDGAKPRRRPK